MSGREMGIALRGNRLDERRRWMAAAAVLAALLLASGCAAGTAVGGADAGPAAGAHDATAHHSFSNVAHWIEVFDDPARDAWQKPAELVAALGIKPGQTVADLGTGTGYFLRWLSPAVGSAGTVYALDVEPGMVEHVRERAAKEGWSNVRPLVCPTDAPGLPDGSTDLVLIVDTWHHIDARLAYLKRLRKALAPGGRVAIVDFRKDVPPPPGPPAEHRLDRSVVLDEFQRDGWRLLADPRVVDPQYVLIFQPS